VRRCSQQPQQLALNITAYSTAELKYLKCISRGGFLLSWLQQVVPKVGADCVLWLLSGCVLCRCSDPGVPVAHVLPAAGAIPPPRTHRVSSSAAVTQLANQIHPQQQEQPKQQQR
jgi:hypothetical protein